MIVKIDIEPVLEKMGELCTELQQQDAYKELRDAIDRFAADSQSVQQYESFVELQELLQQKEQQGAELTKTESEAYERQELELYANDVIRKFLYAQQQFDQLHSLIGQYYVKVVELGRLPKSGELKKPTTGCGSKHKFN